jgi:hypothetical protein
MEIFTKATLYHAYKVGAAEIAKKVMTNALEQAKYHPTIYIYTEKVYAHEFLLDEVHKLLKHHMLGMNVTMTFVEEDREEGTAVFTIDWT